MGSTFKGKDVLQKVQILSFKSCLPINKGGKSETGIVISPECISVQLVEEIKPLHNIVVI